jgi:hypothetical protein
MPHASPSCFTVPSIPEPDAGKDDHHLITVTLNEQQEKQPEKTQGYAGSKLRASDTSIKCNTN